MNPDSPKTPNDELEARLTALLLGELSVEEAAAWRAAIAANPELAKLHDRLKHVIDLVREAATNPSESATAQTAPLKMSEERRQKLLSHFKTVRPKELVRTHRRKMPWFVPMSAAAMFVALIGVAVWLPGLSRRNPYTVTPLPAVRLQSEYVSPELPRANGQKQIVLPPADQSANWGYSIAQKGTRDQPADRGFYEGSGVAGGTGGGGGTSWKDGHIGDPKFIGVLETPAKQLLADVVASPPASETLPQPITGQSDTSLFRRRYGLRPSVVEGESRLVRQGFVATDATTDKLNKLAADTQASTLAIEPATGLPITPTTVENGRADGSGQPPAAEVKLSGITSIIPSNRTLLSWREPLDELARKSGAQIEADGDKVPVLGDLPSVGRFFRPESAPSDTTDLSQEFFTSTNQHAQLSPLVIANSGVVEVGLVENAKSGKNVSLLSMGNKLADASALEKRLPEPASGLGTVPARQLREQDFKNGGAEVAQVAAEVESLKSHIEAKQRDGGKGEKSYAYLQAKRNLEQEVQLRNILTQKIASESTDAALPKTTMVTIVDQAEVQPAEKVTLWQRIGMALGADAESVARIKLDGDVSDINGLGERRERRSYDPYLIQTESEIIQSRAVLGKVVQKLNLNEVWAKRYGSGAKLATEETVKLLQKHLDVRSPQNTDIMEIRVKSDKPEEAAEIANAVAEAYASYRLEQRQQLAIGGVNAMRRQWDQQTQKVQEAQKQVDRLRTELSISDTDAEGKSSIIEADVAPVRKQPTNAPIPQPEIETSENNFSTFSLNVSEVSFKLAAASLEKGQMPDAASVRSEEFINAFDYRDPEPAAGAPIAFAWERARYPFAHNRDLLRFSLKTAAAGRQAGRPLNIVLLLDNSGSMERADRVQIIREALRVLASQLQPQDKLSVITFARTARLVADGISGDNAGELAEQVSGLTPQGGTNLEEAMNLAYATAAKHYLANGINRVALLTDGAANLGDVEPDSLKRKVESQRKQGIALDCFGIGWDGFNDDLLEVLSRNGDGRYGFINSPEEAATDFVGQLAGALKVAASDVKVQVEFNPKRVTTYRQIGYAKHQLTKEQFRDNTVDAAEIAAQEAGNALYTVEVNPAGDGPLCTVRVRYKIPGTSDFREQEWDVPFTGNALSLEQSSPAMRLAAGASAFSEWLVASPFAGEVTPDALLGYLSGVPGVYGADSRPMKLEWMIRQAKSLEGK